jgi:branched-chain amino acid transport system permease protein
MSLLDNRTIDDQVTTPTPATRRRRPNARFGRLPRPAWFGITVIALFTVYFTMSGSTYLFTFNLCLLAALGAIALNMLQGTAGMVSVGNPAFMAVGAFSAVFALHVGIPFPGDVVIGALTAAAAGVIIGAPALRLRGLQLFLATMAGHFLVVHFAEVYQRDSKAGSASGFIFNPLYLSRGIDGAQRYWAWTLFGVLAVVILGASRLMNERSGRAWRMIRDHEIVAHTLGIRVVRYKMLAFVLTSGLIGVEGALMAHFTGSATAEAFTLSRREGLDVGTSGAGWCSRPRDIVC